MDVEGKTWACIYRTLVLGVLLSLVGCKTPQGEGGSEIPERIGEKPGGEPVDTGEYKPVDDTESSLDSGFPTTQSDVDCLQISAANSAWEVCEQSETECAGVFTDGAGCRAYCAAAGLVCTERYGGEPNCNKEPQNVLDCDANNGHQSDWCVCGEGEATPEPSTDPDCPVDPNNPPQFTEMRYRSASFSQRNNWVLDCYDYAYTAGSDEHRACDATYNPDGSRTGKASFQFSGIPRGRYTVSIGGRHTENRNSSGARVVVDGHVQTINQRVHSPDYVWDVHGTYCLEGSVEVVLDSTVNSGSDSIFGVRLQPAE